MGDLDDSGDLLPHVIVASRPQGGDVDHHVDLGRAFFERPPCFEDFGGRRGAAVRKADNGADLDVRSIEQRARARHIAGTNRGGRDIVAGRQLAAVRDEGVIELGPQQRVVDRLGDLRVGQPVKE